ncbi:MAG: hypothetical protein KC656_11170 [Myxococcales bacterium]|nr:hypothetical protein [Myxococcales bacterium]
MIALLLACGGRAPQPVELLKAPTDLVGTLEGGRVQLDWSPVDSATSYWVLRGPAWYAMEPIAEVGDPSFPDNTVMGVYGEVWYAVVAVAEMAESVPSGPVAVELPRDWLTITEVTPLTATLAWEPIEGADGYRLWRGDGAYVRPEQTLESEIWTPLPDVLDGLSVVVERPRVEEAMAYRVQALDGEGGLAVSGEVYVARRSVPHHLAGSPGDGRVRLRWKHAEQLPLTQVDHFTVRRDGVGVFDHAVVDPAFPPEQFEWVDEGLVNGELHTWTVQAVGPGGEDLGTSEPLEAKAHRFVDLGGRGDGCAVDDGGEVVCWLWPARASDPWGTLGTGDLQPLPGSHTVRTADGSALDATAVALAEDRTCVVRGDGTVACWGRPFVGAVPDLHPVPVSGLPPAYDIVAGEQHFCVLATDGSVWCWGDATHGQLGDGTVGAPTDTPVQVLLADTALAFGAAEALAATDDNACALRNGVAYCWGSNVEVQSGGVGGPSTMATQIVGDGGIAFGGLIRLSGTCAASFDDRVWCWGPSPGATAGPEQASELLVPDSLVIASFFGGPVSQPIGRPLIVGSDGVVWSGGTTSVVPVDPTPPGFAPAADTPLADSGGLCALDAGGEVLCLRNPGGGGNQQGVRIWVESEP